MSWATGRADVMSAHMEGRIENVPVRSATRIPFWFSCTVLHQLTPTPAHKPIPRR
ncbi:hypothetical protein ACFOOK_00020 [Micromonospora krabiensis]|uniref:hypothetical protein n=1 Tax=Micromonospora krabiensis TaxID=307121 RepID=UPI0036223C16